MFLVGTSLFLTVFSLTDIGGRGHQQDTYKGQVSWMILVSAIFIYFLKNALV